MKFHYLKPFLVSAIFTLSILTFLAESACKNFDSNKNCPIDSPCCNSGWCSNDPRFCSTGCEPENSFTPKSCFPKPYCVNMVENFDNPKIVNIKNFNGDPIKYDWTSDFEPDYASFSGGNLLVSMKYDSVNKNSLGNYQGFGSTVSTTRWMEYGRVTARIKTASSNLGVVSSFITRNTAGDEIDFEWVGLEPSEVQSNYYWQGVLDYTQGTHHKTGGDTSKEYHEYGIEWLPDHITWFLDGAPLRTVTLESTKASNGSFLYPSGPQRIQFSVWDGGMTLKGTADWAGTPTDWSDKNRVYTMSVDWVNITCYYGGNATSTWPPAGYGPPNITLANNGSYSTLGVGSPNLGGNDHGGAGPGGANTANTADPDISIPPPNPGLAAHSIDQMGLGLVLVITASVMTSIILTMKQNYLI
ncbi:hypothetical protein G9A89_016814 [Geosiphon pyriformis]|nr:hypothetical protein G9A89_016814 [Geosiphon pyriformis]